MKYTLVSQILLVLSAVAVLGLVSGPVNALAQEDGAAAPAAAEETAAPGDGPADKRIHVFAPRPPAGGGRGLGFG